MSDTPKMIPLSEVVKHKAENDLWMIINQKVYNITSFVDQHPGGVDSLTGAGGRDGTDDFNAVGHSDFARNQLEKYYVGELHPDDAANMKPPMHGTKSNFSTIAILIALMAICVYLIFAP
ncbi:cytochrome b5-like [Trypanosoma grayi]|uniref:cytochrome b5-like n=1 Tax=Trypanosoma grayi TaxID=71804 RepID=UPI0004F48556|nr:cytochrome b5-like [Trypanosoma grayi]KEG12005.1 cytochrome b5-like [Trypanosoma grayi]